MGAFCFISLSLLVNSLPLNFFLAIKLLGVKCLFPLSDLSITVLTFLLVDQFHCVYYVRQKHKANSTEVSSIWFTCYMVATQLFWILVWLDENAVVNSPWKGPFRFQVSMILVYVCTYSINLCNNIMGKEGNVISMLQMKKWKWIISFNNLCTDTHLADSSPRTWTQLLCGFDLFRETKLFPYTKRLKASPKTQKQGFTVL